MSIKFLLPFVMILSLVYSHGTVPNLVVFNTEDLALLKTRYEISQIYDNFLASQVYDIPSWQYTDAGYLWNQYLNVKNLKIDLNKTLLNIENLDHEIFLDSQVLLGRYDFNIYYTFEFDAKIGITTYSSGSGQLVFNSNLFSFTKQQIKRETYNGANATIDLNFNYSYSFTPNSDDVYLIEYFKIIFKLNANAFTQKLKTDFQKETDKFYQQQQKTNPISFPLNITNPATSYEVDLIYLENPKYENGRGITYYHCGEINNVLSKKGFLNKPVPNHKKWDNFSIDDGNFQVFLGHHMLSELFVDISQTKSFKFFVNQSKLPNNTEFNLDIDSLGQISPEFYKYLPRDTKLTVMGQIRNLTFDIDDSEFVGQFILTLTLLNQNIPIFQYESFITYNILPIYNKQFFNVRINSPINIVDMTTINTSFQYGTVDMNLLKEWTANTINKHLVENPFYVFREHINFSQFFSSSKIMIIPYQGIVLAGEPVYQYKLSAPSNFIDILMREFKNNLNN